MSLKKLILLVELTLIQTAILGISLELVRRYKPSLQYIDYTNNPDCKCGRKFGHVHTTNIL